MYKPKALISIDMVNNPIIHNNSEYFFKYYDQIKFTYFSNFDNYD